MIDLHYCTTPNRHKVTIFLEEAGLPYRIIPVNLGRGDQFKSELLAVQGQKLEDFPHAKRWFNAITATPTTKRAYELAMKSNTQPSANYEASQKILFGQIAASVNV